MIDTVVKTNRFIAAHQLVSLATETVELKRALLWRDTHRAVCSELAVKQFGQVEKDLVKVLVPFFVSQIDDMANRLGKLGGKRTNRSRRKGIDDEAAGLARLIFDPKEWKEELIDTVLPILARRMTEAAVTHLMTIGVDVRRKSSDRSLIEKATTATEWLEQGSGDWEELLEALREAGVDIRLMTEIPVWMQQAITERLQETFAQDYWSTISETTLGDAEKFLKQGLSEGWSIDRIARSIRENFMGGGLRYARARSEAIARTEAGHSLNGARKDSVARLQEELGPQVPMKQTWLSVLGNTTRASHANLDQVPEDENGLWNLGGVMVPWPAHISLPPENRINCFPAGTLVEGDFVGSQRAWYEGAFAEIILRSGRRLTVTPQHPVVTSEGLVPAGQLKPGKKVLTYLSETDALSSESVVGCYQKENEPVVIEELFQAFLAGSVETSSTVEFRRTKVDDFYGDAEFFHGDIEIVGTDWNLLGNRKFGQFEKQGDAVFILVDSNLLFVSGNSPLHFPFHGVTLPFSSDPCLAEPTRCGRRSIARITPTGSLAVGIAANFDTCLSKSSAEDGPGISSFLREALERHSRFIAFDDVVEIRNFYSAGHVYDLQSRYGLVVASSPHYTALTSGGMVLSNCQCTVAIEFGMDDGEALQLIGEHEQRVREHEEAQEE